MADQNDVRRIALSLPETSEAEALLRSDEEKFFIEPHYNGFPAILVRLPTIDVDELEELVVGAWCCQAPAALVASFGAGG
jgi:hypothetical protein